MKKIFKTTFDFPIVEILCDVKYSQVEKPSGISYILLMIIDSSKNVNDNFSSLLESFGVPKDLHDIFANELNRLISLKIIKFRNNNWGDSDYYQFNNYIVGDFLFTEKGKKIFIDEAIPSDEDIQIKINVFWNIARNELLVSQDKLLSAEQSLIPQSIFDNNRFTDNNKLEDFLVQHRGKGIKIKSEEIITEVLPFNFQNYVKTYSADVEIEDNNISFLFQDKSIESFFNNEYNSQLIESLLKSKDAFKFKGNIHNYYNKLQNDSDVLIPSDIDKELKLQTYLDIYRNDYKPSESTVQIQSSTILDLIGEDVEFIKISNSESGYYYIPALIFLENGNFGKILVNILIKKALTKLLIKDIARLSIKEFSTYSKDNIKSLSSICQKFEINDSFKEIVSKYTTNNIESDFFMFKEIKDLNIQNKAHIEIIKEFVKTDFDNFLNGITLKNLNEKLDIIYWVPSFLSISNISLLEKTINTIKPIESDYIDIFEIFENKKFEIKDILVYLNPIPLYFKIKSSNGTFGNMILNFISIINEMKKVLGISSIHDKIKDDFDREIFLKTFNNFNKSYLQVREYEKYFDGKYGEVKLLFEITSQYNKTINDEKNAELNPGSITQNFVSSKILAGDYRSAIMNLSIKLESILKTNYKLKGKLSDMIDDANKNKIIDDIKHKELSDFRKIRNSFGAHYQSENIVVKAADLEDLNKTIFDLIKIKEEKNKK
jgi:hypothetical protein